eukprot:3298996-Pyramimonas_sp.AAC.1
MRSSWSLDFQQLLFPADSTLRFFSAFSAMTHSKSPSGASARRCNMWNANTHDKEQHDEEEEYDGSSSSS